MSIDREDASNTWKEVDMVVSIIHYHDDDDDVVVDVVVDDDDDDDWLRTSW